MKTKVFYIIAALLLLMMNSRTVSAQFLYEPMEYGFMELEYPDFGGFSNSYAGEWQYELFPMETGYGFLLQSDLFYAQAMNTFYPDNFNISDNFLTNRFKGLLLGMGGEEGMDTGDDTSDNDHDHFANDVPLGDGILPLFLAGFAWLLMVFLKSLRNVKSLKTAKNPSLNQQ